MKSKTSVDHKKQTIVVKDLKTKKNPKGGGLDCLKHKDQDGNLKRTLNFSKIR